MKPKNVISWHNFETRRRRKLSQHYFVAVLSHTISGPSKRCHYCRFYFSCSRDLHIGISDGRELRYAKVGRPSMPWHSHKTS